MLLLSSEVFVWSFERKETEKRKKGKESNRGRKAWAWDLGAA
jgi:hypothetical protein